MVGLFLGGINQPRQVLLVRHGATQLNLERRYIGRTDTALVASGAAAVAALRPALSVYNVSACLVSPAQRARQSAQLLATGLVAVVAPNLREIDFGRWEGQTFAEIATADPGLVESWAQDEPAFVFPGGEGVAAFGVRVRLAAAQVLAHPAQSLLLVCHGGVIRYLICALLGLAMNQKDCFAVDAASLSVLELYPEGAQLRLLNYVAGRW